VAIHPARATIELAGTYVEAGDWAEARALLHKVRALDPQMRAHDVAWTLATLEGHLEEAMAALQASAVVARRPGSVFELGVTLADLAEVARAQGATDVAASASADLTALVERIGPEIRRLGCLWATPRR
jgi:hypothetical protein